MYMRIVRPRVATGREADLVREWEAFVLPRIRAVPGFRHTHLGRDQLGGQLANVTLVKDQAGVAALEQLTDEVRAHMQGLGIAAGPPAVETYEIVASS